MSDLLGERIRLVPIAEEHAPAIQAQIGHPSISRFTLNIPYPYPEGGALEWLTRTRERIASGLNETLAIIRRDREELVGVVSLMDISAEHRRAEIGYWLGVDHRGQGFMSEAVDLICRHGFEVLDINRIEARVFSVNRPSLNVLMRAGFTEEGVARQCWYRDGGYFDGVWMARLAPRTDHLGDKTS